MNVFDRPLPRGLVLDNHAPNNIEEEYCKRCDAPICSECRKHKFNPEVDTIFLEESCRKHFNSGDYPEWCRCG